MQNIDWVKSAYSGGSYDAWTRRFEEQYKNQTDYSIDVELACNLFINRFVWQSDLLGGRTPGYIERCILYYGACGIAFDENYGLIMLPAQAVARNPFGDVSTWRMFNFGYDVGDPDTMSYTREFPTGTIAIISDTPQYVAPIKMIKRYCQRTSDMNRVEEVYARGLKSPNIAFVSSKNKDQQAIINQQISENKELIVLDKDLVGEDVLPQTFQSGKTASELVMLMKATNYKFSQLMARLGLAADEMIKGANMTEDEVYQNGELARRVLASAKQSREFGIQQARELFGAEISFKELMVLNPAIADEREEPKPTGGKDGKNE